MRGLAIMAGVVGYGAYTIAKLDNFHGETLEMFGAASLLLLYASCLFHYLEKSTAVHWSAAYAKWLPWMLRHRGVCSAFSVCLLWAISPVLEMLLPVISLNWNNWFHDSRPVGFCDHLVLVWWI